MITNEKFQFAMPKKQAIQGAVETVEKAFKIDRAELLQALDAQCVKHGRWIWDSNAPYREHGAYKCNNCGCHSDFEENYCCNCGARMDGDAE